MRLDAEDASRRKRFVFAVSVRRNDEDARTPAVSELIPPASGFPPRVLTSSIFITSSVPAHAPHVCDGRASPDNLTIAPASAVNRRRRRLEGSAPPKRHLRRRPSELQRHAFQTPSLSFERADPPRVESRQARGLVSTRSLISTGPRRSRVGLRAVLSALITPGQPCDEGRTRALFLQPCSAAPNGGFGIYFVAPAIYSANHVGRDGGSRVVVTKAILAAHTRRRRPSCAGVPASPGARQAPPARTRRCDQGTPEAPAMTSVDLRVPTPRPPPGDSRGHVTKGLRVPSNAHSLDGDGNDEVRHRLCDNRRGS